MFQDDAEALGDEEYAEEIIEEEEEKQEEDGINEEDEEEEEKENVENGQTEKISLNQGKHLNKCNFFLK